MKKIVLMLIGLICVVLGSIGIVLPVLPTTPFLLVALWCFLRSSDKLYNYVLNNKHLGPFVRGYMSNEGIPLKSKKKAIALLWLTIGFSIIVVIDSIMVKCILLLVASLVSLYIATRKTAPAS